jgi:hypothetical protein
MNSKGDGVGAAAESQTEVAPVEQPETRSVLLGAELLNWSDLEPDNARASHGGPAALELLGAVLTGQPRVLVAGPHTLEVLEHVADKAGELDILLRSYADAETVAEQFERARVFAGGLDRFSDEHGSASYDVVVALDGIPRLAGPDTPELVWAEAVAVLRKRLAPQGVLLLGATNPFGLDRVLGGPRLPKNDEWGRDVGAGGEPPAGLTATRAALDATGPGVAATYSLFPDVTTPELALQDPAEAPALIARAVARHHAAGPKLADPYRTAYDAVAAGLGTALAPGYWFVLGDAPELPDRLNVGPQPGELVEERLLAATRADDHQALRREVSGYVDWLQTQDHGTAAAAATDNVVTDGSAYRLLDQDPDAPGGTHSQLAIRHLAGFVTRSMAAGARQPWSAGGTPRVLTGRLAAMARIEIDDELWQGAGVADTAVTPQGHAEQLAVIERLTAELADARSQVDWFEGQLDKLRKSRSYRVGRAIVSPLRATYGKLRTRLR